MNSKKILITSALLYANGAPHFGHIAGAYLPADCYARFMRFFGNQVLFISGSDEYGAPITLSAEKEGKTPKQHVDEQYEQTVDLFKKFDFSFDHFSRTTWPGHAKTVLEFFQDLKKNGYLEKKVTKQLYSSKDQKFLADRYVVGTCPKCGFEEARGDECPKCGASYESSSILKPKSKLSGAPLELKETEHYFFCLDKLKEPLKKWIKTKDWKAQVYHMALEYIENAHPRSITRDLNWGIPVPHEKDKVFYVWFDAPIGYISASKDWAERVNKPDAWKDFWCDPKTHYVQFLGKDNIPFHAVFFPAMIMGQDQPYKQVDELPANSFFHYEGKKFSKSDGWTIDLHDFFSKYDSDAIRYCLAANAPENGDSDFSWKDFQSKVNADLVGKFGNFIHRTLTFIQQKNEGLCPSLDNLQPRDALFIEALEHKLQEMASSYESFHLRQAAHQLMELASLCNVYFDEMQPWKVAKSDQARLQTILAACLWGIKALAIASFPIVPKAAQKIWNSLGFTDLLTQKTWQERTGQPLLTGQKLPTSHIIFKKVEDMQIEDELKKLKKDDQNEGLDFDDFLKLELKVAEVLEAEEVPKSKKLLKLKVSVGEEKRTVVSGIKSHYSPESLIGKKVILVANLKPAKIMGIESQGMILAGSHDELLEVPMLSSLPSGSKVS